MIRKVKTSERLPEKQGLYFVRNYNGHADIFTWTIDHSEPVWQEEYWKQSFEYWLEEFEISDEEIEAEAYSCAPDPIQEDQIWRDGWIACGKWMRKQME